MQRGSQPLPWRAKGLSDAVDGSTTFNGSMSALQNLIPDPTTAQLWECRPAAFLVYDTTQNHIISVFKIVGNIIYGMVGEADGSDHPFAYDLANNIVVPVTGGVAGTLPQSQPATGSWIPPVMDLIGSKLMVAHFGFGVIAPPNYVGWFDLATPTAPVWHAGNITGQPFIAAPISVAQFNGRAYYITNAVISSVTYPAVIFSDINNPLSATGAGTITPVLTFGDNTPLTALGQLRLYNQLGGIIQALIVFKDSINVYQITGDASGTPGALAINAMNFATGTKSPNSVCSTPRGLAFMSPEGLRIIDFSANISDPIGYDGQGVSAPFIYTNVPSRICAACNGNLIRITTQNQLVLSTSLPSFQEYWFDLARNIWSGPHTCTANFIQPYGGTFIASLIDPSTGGNPASGSTLLGKIWQSNPNVGINDTFIENGNQLTWSYATSYLPDTDQMGAVHVSQSLLDCALTAGTSIAISVSDQNNSTIDSVSLVSSGGGALWGAPTTWGHFTWGTPGTALVARKLPWHMPLVFVKAKFTAMGQSAGSTRLGAWHFRYKQLRYLTDTAAAA